MITATEPLYFTVATAGHVDHGKTSLLRALTGIDPDRLKEEKQRQMTTDLGFAHLTIKPLPTGADRAQSEANQRDYKVGFIDVPGHGKFLKNMLAGVGGIDLALLVVAADEGPMPQTIQHVKILALLGVGNVLVIVNKVDVASDEQKQLALSGTKELLAKYGLNCVDVLFVSSTRRIGIEAIPTALRSALSAVTKRELENGTPGYPTPGYLPIDRVFSKAGYGVVITGTLVRGFFRVGDSVYVEPGNIQARVRGLESFGEQRQQASAGQRVAMNLVLKANKPLARGQAVFGQRPSACQTLIADLNLFESDTVFESVDDLVGQQIRLYHGTAEKTGHIRWLERVQTKEGEKTIAQISLTEMITAEPADKFVLRYGDFGIAGGVILIGARPRWLTRKRLMPLAILLIEHQFEAAANFCIENNPQRMLNQNALEGVLPLPKRQLVQDLLQKSIFVRLGDYVTNAKVKDELQQRILSAVEKATSAGGSAESAGINLETLRSSALSGLDKQAFQQLVKAAIDAGSLIKEGDKVKLPGSDETKTAAQCAGDTDEIMKLLAEHVCLEIDEIAEQLKRDRATVLTLINQLSKQGKASVVNYDFASSNEALQKAHVILAQLWQEEKGITPSNFKERLGVTRKYAMPLLSYFDDHSITRRTAEGRMLLKQPK